MKIALVLLAMFAFAKIDPTDYPYHVRIIEVRSLGHSEQGFGDFGIGSNSMIGGFEFVSDCDPFGASHGSDFYRGQLNSEKHTLTLLMSRIGEEKIQQCKLKINVKPFIYFIDQNGRLTTRTPQ
jgi:hypothetical protein